MVEPLTTASQSPAKVQRPQRNFRTLGVPLPPEVFAAFTALAAADGRTPGALGRMAILEFLAHRKSTSQGGA